MTPFDKKERGAWGGGGRVKTYKEPGVRRGRFRAISGFLDFRFVLTFGFLVFVFLKILVFWVSDFLGFLIFKDPVFWDL